MNDLEKHREKWDNAFKFEIGNIEVNPMNKGLPIAGKSVLLWGAGGSIEQKTMNDDGVFYPDGSDYGWFYHWAYSKDFYQKSK